MTIQYEDSIESIKVSLGSVRRSGPDGEFAYGLPGLGLHGGVAKRRRLIVFLDRRRLLKRALGFSEWFLVFCKASCWL